MSAVDLSSLPAPQIIDVPDFETLLTARKARLVSLYPDELQDAVARALELESEPQLKILQENCYREILLRQRINEAVQAVIIARSGGGDLDNLVANFNVQRLVVTPANETAVPPVPAVMESDEDLRQRAPEAFEGLSVAGPELQLQQQWRHASNNRVGLRPSLQFLGPDSDVITLSGVLMPAITGGRLSMQMLELMAETGKGWPLLKGNGTIYGMFVIENIGRTESEFFSDGSPRKIEFTVTLKRMDESLSQMLGDLSGQLAQLKDNAVSSVEGLLS